jgi:hypothetical protein
MKEKPEEKASPFNPSALERDPGGRSAPGVNLNYKSPNILNQQLQLFRRQYIRYEYMLSRTN